MFTSRKWNRAGNPRRVVKSNYFTRLTKDNLKKTKTNLLWKKNMEKMSKSDETLWKKSEKINRIWKKYHNQHKQTQGKSTQVKST